MAKSVKLYGHYTAQEFCERIGCNYDVFTGEITDTFFDDKCTHIPHTHGCAFDWSNHTFTFTLFVKGFEVVVLGIRSKD